jgi:hypothetical protein
MHRSPNARDRALWRRARGHGRRTTSLDYEGKRSGAIEWHSGIAARDSPTKRLAVK